MSPSPSRILAYPLHRWLVKRAPVPDGRLRPVSFRSADGVRLSGWYAQPSGTAATIILCHGLPGEKRDMAGLAAALMDAGFGVLAFDFRNWGGSDRTPVTFGYREVRDVVGAVEFVQDRRAGGSHNIGVVGLSMGAAAAILAAAVTPAIQAVVADSSYARLDQSVERVARRFLRPLAWLVSRRARLDKRLVGVPLAAVAPVEAIAHVSPRPVLLIHGGRDRLTDVEDAYALYRACGDPKTLWIIERAGHAGTRRVGPEEYDRRIVGFLRRHLAIMTR